MDPYGLGLVAIRIHYFQSVAQHGSIRQAAQALNVAPSSVSRILRQLEEDLGTPLFERVRQRLKLTSAGERLFHRARLSLSELSRACSEISGLQGLDCGTVSIAVIESAARNLVPDVLKAFWAEYPAVSADVRIMGAQQAANAVAEGECDLAIVFDITVPRAIRRIATVSLPLGLLALPNSPFAGNDALTLADLAGQQVILSDSSLTLGAWVEEAFSRSSVDIRARARTNSIGLMIEFAKRGLGTVLQTRVGIERELADASLSFVPLGDDRLGLRKLMVLARPEREMSMPAATLSTLLAQSLEQLVQGDLPRTA